MHASRIQTLASHSQADATVHEGRWVPSLVYADDVVLLSWTSAGLQSLLDGMHSFCQALGLTISPSKTEVVVFNGTASGTWHVGQHVLPQSASFKYLALVFHESGSILPAFAEWQGYSSPFECQAQGAHVQQVISHDEAPVRCSCQAHGLVWV